MRHRYEHASPCWPLQLRLLQLNSTACCNRHIAGNPDDWEDVIKLNVLAPMRLTRRIAPPMAEAHDGIIINMCSVAGLTGQAANAVYATSKHGLRGWSRSSYEVGYGLIVWLHGAEFQGPVVPSWVERVLHG